MQAVAVVDVLSFSTCVDIGVARDGVILPYALGAGAIWQWGRGQLSRLLHGCASGQELATRGYASDVDLASAYAASETVPVLREGAFVALETV